MKIKLHYPGEIRREGDFNINIEIEAYQENLELAAVRRSKTTKEKLPCSGCKGWFVARAEQTQLLSEDGGGDNEGWSEIFSNFPHNQCSK